MYGHPSLNRGFREHRMRIYPEEFVKIGYGFNFKQDILIALCEDNKLKNSDTTRYCNPKLKKVTRKKPGIPSEKSDKLPEHVRKHFNHYWQICKACGCKQGKKLPQNEISFEDEEENE